MAPFDHLIVQRRLGLREDQIDWHTKATSSKVVGALLKENDPKN